MAAQLNLDCDEGSPEVTVQSSPNGNFSVTGTINTYFAMNNELREWITHRQDPMQIVADRVAKYWREKTLKDLAEACAAGFPLSMKSLQSTFSSLYDDERNDTADAMLYGLQANQAVTKPDSDAYALRYNYFDPMREYKVPPISMQITGTPILHGTYSKRITVSAQELSQEEMDGRDPRLRVYHDRDELTVKDFKEYSWRWHGSLKKDVPLTQEQCRCISEYVNHKRMFGDSDPWTSAAMKLNVYGNAPLSSVLVHSEASLVIPIAPKCGCGGTFLGHPHLDYCDIKND